MTENHTFLEHVLKYDDPDLDTVRVELSRSALDDIIVSDISGTSAYDIYSARGRINDRRGKKIKGYERLIRSLELAKEHKIRILWLILPSVGFRIFVDLSTSQLLGVLIGRGESRH